MTVATTGSPEAIEPAERRRQQRAWYWYDWANSAYVTTVATVLLGPYLTVIAKRAACPGQDTDLACRTDLSVLGIPVSPGSVALYAVTVATLFSAVLLPVIGAIADRSGRKRTMMCGFAWAGSAAAAAMVFVTGDDWQLGVLLQMIGTLCLGSSLVVYDAILCDISTPEERDAVSSRGWALGYLGGGLLLALNLGLVTAHDAVGIGTDTAVRLSLLSAGLWWAAFTIIPFRGLTDRPPVALPIDGGPPGVAQDERLLRASFGQLGHTLRHLRGYPHTMLFLAAYLFFNDGIQTVIYASSIFGQEELGLEQSNLILTILVVQFVAFFGALLFGRVARSIGSKRTILAGLVLWAVVVGIGYVLPRGEFLPFVSLGVLIGLVLGGTQALARSLYSLLVPKGREAEYFSLYQATERGTSWFGTFLFGLIYQLSGSYRDAILALVAFFVIGGVLLWKVDVEAGMRDAQA